uniref:U28-Theraphotoxin-Ct1a_1 n=1 Tax=Coremiocnemis tropix TaxID=1904443 RepID=A0A482ZCI8_CORTR
MKNTSILFILGLTLLLVLAFEAQVGESDGERGEYWWRYGREKPPCCRSYDCSKNGGFCPTRGRHHDFVPCGNLKKRGNICSVKHI